MSQLNKIQEEIELEWKAYINLEGTIHDAYITFLSPHFTFGQSTLYLQLGGKFIRNPEETTLGLIRKDDFRMKFHSTLCTFGLKMQDGDVLMLGTQVMKENDKQIIKRFRGLSEEIAQRLEDILHNDLTLTFTLKLEVIHRVEPDISNEPQCKKLREESTLSRDFEDLFINKLNCDVTVQVKDKEYPAHKAILVARSKAFEEMFLQENAENCSGIITVRDCDPDAFYHFLKYLYCGSLGTLSFQHAFALYEIAAKYDVLELKIFCREKILENFIVEKFDEVVALADKYDDVILMSSLEYYFHEKAEDIIETAGWRNLIQNKSSLTSRLLGRQFR